MFVHRAMCRHCCKHVTDAHNLFCVCVCVFVCVTIPSDYPISKELHILFEEILLLFKSCVGQSKLQTPASQILPFQVILCNSEL